jgi:hypothetical protein
MKTTRRITGEFLDAMCDLVHAASFMHWVHAMEQDEQNDGDYSFRNAIMRAREELMALDVGITLPTVDEAHQQFVDTLGLSSEEFIARLGGHLPKT